MAADEILFERVGDVGVITLNRPSARNAVNAALAEALAAALDQLDAAEDLVVGVLTGAGGTFCAGMDLKAFAGGEVPSVPGRGFAGIVERPPATPLIAAVEGHAVAGGFEVALACDLLVAGAGASFGLPEVRRGLVAAGGGLLRLPRRIPYHVAMEMALTGAPIGARRAAELGLVSRVVTDGEALPAALSLASDISANGPLALRTTKRIVTESPGWPPDRAFAEQAVVAEAVYRSEDAQEGARAFAEKRPPAWKGR